MGCKYSSLVLLAAVLLCAIGNAAVQNGGFEDTEPNAQVPFDPPEIWARDNFAAVEQQFIPDPCEGNVDDWVIDLEQGLRPVEGQSFVVLSSGDVKPDPWLASIYQSVYAYTGQTLSGYYFFGTADYLPYNDYAAIKLIPLDPNSSLRDITVVRIDVSEVNDHGSMKGWEYFERTFSQSEAGGYQLVISVSDMEDQVYPSYLAVDGLTLCNQPPGGDINRDCYVDFVDFSWLATDWLEDCNDPNYFSDPNSNCYRGTDINKDGPVDYNDLYRLSEGWLCGDGD